MFKMTNGKMVKECYYGIAFTFIASLVGLGYYKYNLKFGKKNEEKKNEEKKNEEKKNEEKKNEEKKNEEKKNEEDNVLHEGLEIEL